MARIATNVTEECDSTLLRRKSKTTSAQGISSHTARIACSWFIVTVPITALTVALLVMVFHYSLNHKYYRFENLRLPSAEDESDMLYVSLNSGIILFVASWVSSLAPLLSGFVLSLASFPIARRLFYDFHRGRTDRLPTPYQLALTLKFIDGSALGGIWNWVLYLFSWRKNRQPQTPPLVVASSVAVLATILGLLVSVADAWLHLTTSTVLFTYVSPTAIQPDYSFGLVPECLNTNNSIAAQNPWSHKFPPCSVTYRGVKNSTVSLQVMSNISADSTVYTYTDPHGKPFTYLGVPEHADLFRRDFTARTYGANTQCQLISKKCNLHPDASFVPFNCSAAFNGDADLSLYSAFFEDKSMEKEAVGTKNYGTGNPYYFALASGESVNDSVIPNSAEFVRSLHGMETYILGCNTTIYDIEYDRLNNTITRFVPSVSNTSVSNIWQTSISYNSYYWNHNIKQATGIAIFSATGQEFANKVALAFSKMTLALGAQGVDRRPTLAAQERETVLAARIPRAPLTTLVVFSLLYVLCGVVLTALAVWAARRKIPDLQAGLSIAGLVADRFEEPSSRCRPDCVEGMFEEHSGKAVKRVGIESIDEDKIYRYTTWKRA